MSHGSHLLWFMLKTHSGLEWMVSLFPFCGLMLPNVSVVLLKCNAFSYSVLRDGAGELLAGSGSTSILLLAILSWYITDNQVEDINVSLE